MKVRVLLVFLASLLSGCTTLEYYWQSARGQLDVQLARRPISAVLIDPNTPETLRRKLIDVQTMVRFAADELALPNQGSYQDYADIGRDTVVWTVVAAPRLSLTARRWCYPVVGCLSYRGFYSPADAAHLAATLQAQGDDVYVAPVRAYSTLGWFADPVLNTVLNGPSWDLAGILFHELTHQKLYISGDTGFNEAYATAVQREGVQRWLAGRGDAAQQQQYQRAQQRQREFRTLVFAYRRQLEAVYQSNLKDSTKLQRRRQIFRAMRGAYADLRSKWQGYSGYDRWFGQSLNNAKLALLATYNDLVPAFNVLLKLKHGDMAALHRTVAQLQGLTPALRRKRLVNWQRAASSLQ